MENIKNETYLGFVFLPSMKKAIDRLPVKKGKDLAWAIIQYGTSGEYDSKDAIIQCVMETLTPVIDASQTRYAETIESGAKGGSKPKYDVDKMVKLHSQGFSYSEIAKQIGCHENTVALHIRRIKDTTMDTTIGTTTIHNNANNRKHNNTTTNNKQDKDKDYDNDKDVDVDVDADIEKEKNKDVDTDTKEDNQPIKENNSSLGTTQYIKNLLKEDIKENEGPLKEEKDINIENDIYTNTNDYNQPVNKNGKRHSVDEVIDLFIKYTGVRDRDYISNVLDRICYSNYMDTDNIHDYFDEDEIKMIVENHICHEVDGTVSKDIVDRVANSIRTNYSSGELPF